MEYNDSGDAGFGEISYLNEHRISPDWRIDRSASKAD